MRAIVACSALPSADPHCLQEIELPDLTPGPHDLLVQVEAVRGAGLRVIASASRAESRAWVRTLGAEAVVDHSAPLPPQMRALGYATVDAIANFSDLDSHWEAMAELIRPQGLMVAIVSQRGPLDLNRWLADISLKTIVTE